MTTRRWLLFGAVLAALIAGCASGRDAVAQGGTFEFVAPGGKTDIFYDPPSRRGRPGPLSGPDLTNPARTLSLDDFAGRVVVINIWGQWCGPCRAEVGQLQRVHEATRSEGVSFLGIDVRDTNPQPARDFVADRHVTYPSIYDPAMRTLIAFGGKYPTAVIPSTLVLDRRHRVAAVFLRELLAEDLQPVVRRVATENATEKATAKAVGMAVGKRTTPLPAEPQ
ncbi:TlpA disulfide reductase family protein [Mycobacterium sp. SM1]|uniref:TlpA disulfide reductase family protein n=1 Tax=Mycobacterium sp. SM1 TaxID=2816243 RepID=UPI0027DB2C65|nr:TlpA disulfide reductase family protein [Mycobacterium sp. SM1]